MRKFSEFNQTLHASKDIRGHYQGCTLCDILISQVARGVFQLLLKYSTNPRGCQILPIIALQLHMFNQLIAKIQNLAP
jgi:hypothetical protein